MRILQFVTGNPKKLREAQEILAPAGFTVEMVSLDIPEMQGEAEDIVREKAAAAYAMLKKPCLVDDTSFECVALNGFPGPYIKHLLSAVGPQGIECMLQGFEDKRAVAVCWIGYTDEKGGIEVFSGRVQGRVVPPRVDNVGFDSIFVPDGYGKTFSEMAPAEKNACSHRRKALDALKDGLERKK